MKTTKKAVALFLAVLMLAVCFAGCTDQKDSGADDPAGTPPDITPQPEAPKVGLSGGYDNTADWPTYNIVYFGDSTFSNSMGDILAAFGEADGIKINGHPRTYANKEGTGTYNIYEACTLQGTAPDYTSANVLINTKQATWMAEELEKADYFVVLSGRDFTIGNRNGEALANKMGLKAWKEYFESKNPNGETILFVPYGFKEDIKSDFLTKVGLSPMSRSQHNELIKKYAAELAEYIGNDCKVAQVGDAYESFIAKNYGIDLYDLNSGRFPSIAGAYYSACVLYSTIFGKSTVGMEVYPGLNEETCKLLQNEAHRAVFGTDPAEVKREENKKAGIKVPEYTDPRLIPMEERDPRYIHETYPENYDVIMSTLFAYDMRGSWVQYESMYMDRVNKSHTRRTIANSAPEDATPQSVLFVDCSAYVYSAYMDTFGYNLNDANRVNHLVKRPELHVFHWADETSEISIAQAKAEFLSVLQPGDLFLTTDYGDTGHVMVYVGNGMMIHCVSDHASGGQSSYYFTADSDSWEYEGGIVWDDMDQALDPMGRFYLFQDNCEVAILRPLDHVGEPTENALNRMNKMYGIMSYKHTTAPEGITVSKGSEVTFTFVMENLNNETRTLEIKDTLPEGVSYKSGDGEFANGVFSAKVELQGGERKTLSYTVTVTAENNTVVEMDEAYINGVRTNNTNISVKNTLTADEQTKLLGLLKEGTAAEDTYTLVASAYAQLGITLPDTLNTAMKQCFDTVPATGTLGSHCRIVKGEKASKILAENLFGGINYVFFSAFNDTVKPIKHINEKSFVVGDILIWSDNGRHGTARVYVYIGEGRFATVSDGAIKYMSQADSLTLTESLMGKFTWMTLRPSMDR